MFKYFLTLFCLINSFSFAYWQTFTEEYITKTDSEKLEILKNNSGKFYLSHEQPIKGTSISAIDLEEGSFVQIRKVNDIYDIKISLSKPVFKYSGTLSLVVLDKDGFSLGYIPISIINEMFSGNLFYHYVGDWSDFYNIHSYEIHLKG